MGEAFLPRRGSTAEGSHGWRKSLRSYRENVIEEAGSVTLISLGAVFGSSYAIEDGRFVLSNVIYIEAGSQMANDTGGRLYAIVGASLNAPSGTQMHHMPSGSITVPSGSYATYSYDALHTITAEDTNITYVVDDDESAYPDGSEGPDGYFYAKLV